MNIAVQVLTSLPSDEASLRGLSYLCYCLHFTTHLPVLLSATQIKAMLEFPRLANASLFTD